MKLFSKFILFVVLLTQMSPSAFADIPKINIRTNLDKARQSFSLSLKSSRPTANNCTVAVFASNSYLQILRNAERTTKIIQVQASKLPLLITTSDIPQLRRASSTGRSRVNLYFRARLQCNTGKRFSALQHEVVNTASQGQTSVAVWLKKLGKLLKKALNPVAQATPTATAPALTPQPTLVAPLPALKLVEAFPALSFNSSLYLTNAHDGNNRIYVVEKGGRIYSFANLSQVNTKTEFLNLSTKIASDGERGVLNLAFHSDFPATPYCYIFYTATNGNLTVARYSVSGSPALADLSSELVLLSIAHARSNHNGGQIAFGPDGYLYIGTGDGGGGGDPDENGQNKNTLLGKILRIDVNAADAGLQYKIPATNPFAGVSGSRGEIYAYGFRNPWRFSFDNPTQTLWVGDVGQGDREEVDIVNAGKNYGWNTMEGSQCYPPGSSCSTAGIELPITEYSHAVGESITGGYVYRGSGIPSLNGYYIYADFVSGKIFALAGAEGPVKVTQIITSTLSIASFGIDETSELYVVDYAGKIYRFAVQ